ncbi:transporter substrate-binding domain-containing protein [Pseudomonas sp. LP_7_YM]|uniref:transporter substrate-binding domain-containing protein n=1 Tax=Pseudomonas sp. LP_7_YM TaxID=2485137 RepID=UPI00105CA2F3|nr:transporter substrate-binding domain-containing protein [Pseudomonas sp. LP_7_YM]TDV60811.1 cyclohexadienyl dehydratase [Pseudomonas sp. LP_7_YM]
MNTRISASLLLGLFGVAQVQAAEVSHLDTVQQKGELAVCTTGDYKPYTFLKSDGQYEGIDIELAQSLAQSLGVKVQWVPTTWKTLMTDFSAGKCDIAVGGISVTLERQKHAFFSNTLDVDGKVPLVRCEDESKYQSIAQINRPDVRLIEPQGGTNEAFARTYLPDAKLEFHDNKTIFQQLLDKKADVMITDASEALYQQKRLSGLCTVNPSRYMQYGEKAYLLPRDDVSWKSYVDQWLHLSKATGAYHKVVAQWLALPSE